MAPQTEGGPSGDGRNFGGQYTAYDPDRDTVKQDYSGHSSDGRRYQNERDAEQDMSLARPNPFGTENRMTASPSGSASGREGKSSGERNRSRTRNGRTASGQLRVCKKCGEPLTGQFVRALGGTFHLDCFRCRDCREIVASKFFPVDEESGEGQYPLCETDYFRRLDLICQKCKGALRGSYITALDKKYHIDHFTCSVCPTVFGAQDSYYEHDGQVYCHYHYSTQFAQRCNGCQTAILKQFVEIFRNGQNQHWHPECYMIHKFWNVRLASSQEKPEAQQQIEDVTDEQGRNAVRLEEERMEEKVYRIWSVLSTFEESSAACISDMLLHVSNGAYVDGVLTAKKFILHVDILFRSADKLDATMARLGPKGLSYAREAKLLCKKIVAFFALLSKTQESGVRKLGVTQELLALVTGLAHYLKLLIRICLQGALKVEREQHVSDCLHIFLEDLSNMDVLKNDDTSLEATTGTSGLGASTSDDCFTCRRDIEDECARCGELRWHRACLKCSNCARELGQNIEDARWSEVDQRVFCNNCESRATGPIINLERVTKLQQYVFLLRVALARLLNMLRSSGALPHTSDDPNLNGYNSNEGYRLPTDSEPPLLRSDTRSKSYGGNIDEDTNTSTYESALNDVRRLRSTRMDRHLSSNIKKARTSRILDGPEGHSVRPGSAGADGQTSRDANMQIVEEREGNNEGRTQLMFGRDDGISLDDIPRIMATQQAKEQRPNAYKHVRDPYSRNSIGAEAKLLNGHERNVSNGNELDQAMAEPASHRREGKRYFSELTALEYFIVRHVAVITMQPLLEGHFTMEELLNLIETRKASSIWKQMGKAIRGNEKKGGKKKGVFGVPLEVIVERDGADSTDGIGPGALRIPAVLDDMITALRKMDLSIEGVFRKNGNIKRLNDIIAIIDKDGCEGYDFNKDNVVQIAALLKRYLRDLPDPILTAKLHKLFIASQKIVDDEKRRRILHLTCCLLPKVHRDSLEILCSFFNWAASFHQVDEESGSKMDTHNLATVVAPNLLYTKDGGPVDDNFLSIEVVNTLIEYNEQMCEVPEDLQSILNDQTLFNNSSDITTKEILKRFGDLGANGGPRHDVQTSVSSGRSKDGSGRPVAPMVTRVDTDPSQAYAWRKESSVRHVDDPSAPYGGSSSNNQHSHQQWQDQGLEQPAPYVHRNGTPDSQRERREYRNSSFRPPNGPVGVTGAN